MLGQVATSKNVTITIKALIFKYFLSDPNNFVNFSKLLEIIIMVVLILVFIMFVILFIISFLK